MVEAEVWEEIEGPEQPRPDKRRRQRGQALVEFAVMMSFTFLLLAGALEDDHRRAVVTRGAAPVGHHVPEVVAGGDRELWSRGPAGHGGLDDRLSQLAQVEHASVFR